MGRASTADLVEAVARAGTVTTDTRNAQKGSVFFALKGERFNGNDYALRALELGCGKAVVDEDRPEFQGPDFFHVEDVLTSLQEVARMYRRTWNFPVFGLTGSNGKTTTKELIHAVVQQGFPGARATRGNLNNEIGVPLTLLEIPVDAGFAVIEMGANAQREIARLAEIAEPTHGLITNIGKAHLEGFGGPEGVKAGKRELFQHIGTTGGTVFVHAGNPVLREISEGLTRVLYGTAEHPPVGTLEDTSEGPVLRWTGPDGRAHGPVAMHLSGDHNLENVLAAIAVGLHFGVTAVQCTLAVSGYQPRNNRSEWRQTRRNSVLLDAYNANPSSMEHAIAHFAGLPQLEKAPGFVVLGDMAELGEYSPQEHARIAALFEETGIEGMCVGPEFAAVVCGKGNVSSCLSPEEARGILAAKALTGRTVLLKGSRSSALEGLLDVL